MADATAETALPFPGPGGDSDGESDGPPRARSTTTCRLVLRGPELSEMLRAFAPLRTCLLDSTLVVGERGVLIQCAIFGEQVFLPLGCEMFSRYEWVGPPAAFLSLVDQKRSLLSALRGGQYPGLSRVDMTISGEAPQRTLRQRVWVEDPEAESGTTELPAATLMKRELASFVVLLPQGRADVQLRLTKPQLAKILALPAGPTTLELGPSGRFSASGGGVCVTFAAREEGAAPSTADAQMQLLSRALKKSDQAALAAKTICGTSLQRTFSLTLGDGNWRAVLKRLQVGGATLKFFFAFSTPSMCVTATGPNAVSAVFLLDPQNVASVVERDGGEGPPDEGEQTPGETAASDISDAAVSPGTKRAPATVSVGASAPKKAREHPGDLGRVNPGPERPPVPPVSPDRASADPDAAAGAREPPEPPRSAGAPGRDGVYVRYFTNPPIIRGPLFPPTAAEPGAAGTRPGPGFGFGMP
ncbi:UL42 [Papiine alphaherpesvirus 2]|uniref:DNA polymerase processivity factor n=1 Tax=Cercopithecine herpesvirus 16 TaxID=340907 RepID=Q2QBD4_CHV16|nr:DNA polymerase processivity subunit [Papiine alphaherpesvirus 2]ABA29296.1 UL42 [Papiine alphaherpesvirus 2]UYB79346.1 DNA polymerase processivity subunit [synthetic construct]UYB79419.1 DNA polymerase processivity subunit [synthetic construct]UYB79493.1 DNA polymerase processivity subunit [Papiine alphaherpesvirus 2]